MTNRIDVYTNSLSLTEDDVRGKTVVVIDVLRASSVIVTALANGARGVIPVEDMGAAGKIAQNLDPSGYLLCGERDGAQIEGYDLGNSPKEYTAEAVSGKTLILTTTNGTRAISRCAHASELYIAGFLNIRAVYRKLSAIQGEVLVVCAGWKGRLSLEDVLCAGQLIHMLYKGRLPKSAKDGARVAKALYDQYGKTIAETISHSNHALRLKQLGYFDDVAYCCEINKFDIVPVLNDGILQK